MISILCSRLCILSCGALYPGYLSFKAVRAKNIDDYVKWMMYWIVFAIFTSIEAFSDIFFFWFPFYYEFKVVFILWILPTTVNGSAFIYKQFIHPLMKKHETRIDYHLAQIGVKGQYLVLQYSKEAVLCIGRNIMNIINKNFPNGALGLLLNQNLPSETAQNSQNIIIDEIEVQQTSNKVKNQRKASTKTSGNKESEVVQNGQCRRRRARQNKQEAYYNLNSSENNVC